ncbi:selenocysteine-specific elongation factor, partial [Planoprotostelium fungivorum]
IKSMQVFHKAVQHIRKGDRAGICVTQLDSKLMERGLACSVGAVKVLKGAVVCVNRIKYFKQTCTSKSKMHEDEYIYNEGMEEGKKQWALLSFDSPVYSPDNSVIIASKLDTDVNANTCRLAFHGRMEKIVDPTNREELSRLKIYTIKSREGNIDRVADDRTLIGKDLFKKETDMSLFIGLKVVRSSNGDVGVIESSFGSSGKFKVRFNKDQKDKEGRLVLTYKRYRFSDTKKLTQ